MKSWFVGSAEMQRRLRWAKRVFPCAKATRWLQPRDPSCDLSLSSRIGRADGDSQRRRVGEARRHRASLEPTRVALLSVLAKGILTAELAAPLRRRDRHPHVDPEVLALSLSLFSKRQPLKKRTHSRIASEITCESAAQTQLDSGEAQHSSGAVGECQPHSRSPLVHNRSRLERDRREPHCHRRLGDSAHVPPRLSARQRTL